MLQGSCLCGKVKYEIDAEPRLMYHCHCGKCRAASGASFVTNIIVATERFKVVAGLEDLSAFESSPNKHRYFNGVYSKHIRSEFFDPIDASILLPGSEVLFIGYPDNRFDIVHNLPILRKDSPRPKGRSA